MSRIEKFKIRLLIKLGLAGLLCFMLTKTILYYFELGQLGLIEHQKNKSSNGYTLFWTNNYNQSFAHLIDMEGNEIHRWNSEINPIGIWRHVQLMPNGAIRVLKYKLPTPETGALERYDWNSKRLQSKNLPIHHTFVALKNGNIIVNCRAKGRRDKNICPSWACENDCIVEMTPSGKEVWNWNILDHIEELKQLGKIEFPRKRNSTDWAHINYVHQLRETKLGKVDSRFRKGNILISIRSLNTIAIISKKSGKIVWAWGKGHLDGQHCPSLLENGRILLLDNGYRTRNYSKVIEIDPLRREIIWSYSDDRSKVNFYSPGSGCVQRLPNGNTLITQAFSGRLFEITREGEIVWDYVSPLISILPGSMRHLFRMAYLSHWKLLPEEHLDHFKLEGSYRFSEDEIRTIYKNRGESFPPTGKKILASEFGSTPKALSKSARKHAESRTISLAKAYVYFIRHIFTP